MPKLRGLLIFFAASVLGATIVAIPALGAINQKITMKPIDPLAQTGNFDFQHPQGEFLGQRVDVPSYSLEDGSIAERQTQQQVLGDTSQPKRIEVDLAAQRLYAFEGDQKVFDFLISSGKYGKTPTGTFHIWGKFRYTKMEGGSKELHTYYYLPNVPFVMFFSNDQIAASRGFSIHGTYWHSNFGQPMSHGCINMKTEEVEQLYYWAQPDIGDKRSGRATADNPGTEITIYGTPPSN